MEWDVELELKLHELNRSFAERFSCGGKRSATPL